MAVRVGASWARAASARRAGTVAAAPGCWAAAAARVAQPRPRTAGMRPALPRPEPGPGRVVRATPRAVTAAIQLSWSVVVAAVDWASPVVAAASASTAAGAEATGVVAADTDPKQPVAAVRHTCTSP